MRYILFMFLLVSSLYSANLDWSDVIPKEFETAPIPRHYFTDSKGNILYNSLGHRGVECFDAFMDNAENKIEVSQ